MTAARSASVMLLQRAISWIVRPQPVQDRFAPSSAQRLRQGVSIT